MVNRMLILGTEYELIRSDESLKEIDADGECRGYSKVIRIRPLKDMLLGDASDEERKDRYNEVLRHEVIHAFFHECGLDDYCNNEELVYWLAMQFPKMLKVFQELGCDG